MCRQLLAGILVLLAATQIGSAAQPRLLSDPDKVLDADRALVLIYGLLGSPVDSFGNWPTLISNDQTELPGHGKLSDFAIYAIDYQADFTSRTKLDDIAIGVARDLATSQIFRRHRHVWLLAHSMGGLVLKRMIVLWRIEEKSQLIDRVMAVGLLGVPSAGAPLADLATKYGIGEVATAFGWNGELLKDLATNSGSYLDGLENDWMAVKKAMKDAVERRFTPIISCGFETKPQLSRNFWSGIFFYLFGSEDIDTIVPKLFTSTACDDRRAFPVKHTDLIKPANESDSLHGWLRALVESSIVQGDREQRVAITTAPPSGMADPLAFNLADRVESMNQDLALDPATQLPKQPERIVFSDAKSKQLAERLVLRGGPFYGSTKLNAWEVVAAKNTCLAVGHTPNRLTISLTVKDDLVGCTGGAFVCRGQQCS